jgi:S-DNA-T family DNA segregation ATPase FtsK/SpoIIIE
MPHLLIAGATGMGKSVFLNSILISLIYQNSPSDLRFILVDPKRVEFTAYNDIPHLLAPVLVDPYKTISSLKWLVMEMERRYKIFADHKVRFISAFNAANPDSKMPYIVLIIDELADLMAVSAREVEAYICRLAQMSRAVGIHLVLATQRPSVDVITGLIKANFPSRLAFAVTSGTDSRTILDTVGADKLLGNGDMLFLPSDASKPRRIQGAFVTDKEIQAVTDFVKKQSNPIYIDELIAETKTSKQSEIDGGGDDLLDEAMELVVKTGKASASYLQRRFRIGYARAARLLDLLENKGVVGPGEGAKPREILMARADLDGGDEGFEEGKDF